MTLAVPLWSLRALSYRNLRHRWSQLPWAQLLKKSGQHHFWAGLELGFPQKSVPLWTPSHSPRRVEIRSK